MRDSAGPFDSADAKVRRRRGTGKVRVTDVARVAGVAPITVSRVINTPDAVAPETLQRVREAIERTGYVPNMLAGGLASSRSRLVAAVVPSITSPVFRETVGALADTLMEAGYQLMLGQSGYADSHEDELVDAIIGRRPDGIVLTGIAHSPGARRRLLASGIPVVETWDLTPTPVDMLVGFSHEGIGAAVAEYLDAVGRRRVAIATASDERARRRAEGLIAAAKRLDFAEGKVLEVPTFATPAPGTLRSGRRAFAHFHAKYPDVDAIFCSSDMIALGVMTEARAAGVRVPDDVAVIGYGDLDFAADLLPSLTTVRVNATAIGQLAARFVIDRAQARPIAQRVVDVGFSIVRRESA